MFWAKFLLWCSVTHFLAQFLLLYWFFPCLFICFTVKIWRLEIIVYTCPHWSWNIQQLLWNHCDLGYKVSNQHTAAHCHSLQSVRVICGHMHTHRHTHRAHTCRHMCSRWNTSSWSFSCSTCSLLRVPAALAWVKHMLMLHRDPLACICVCKPCPCCCSRDTNIFHINKLFRLMKLISNIQKGKSFEDPIRSSFDLS